MPLTVCANAGPADWIVASTRPPDDLIACGPEGFAAYARLRYIADPTRPGQSENDVPVEDDHPSDIEQARRALHLLSAFTSTPDEWYFCLWDGYGDSRLPPVGHPCYVELPHRRYALLQGSLTDLQAWPDLFAGFPPAFAWPADRKVCFTCDVDPHWAFLGGPGEAIAALLDDEDLDVVRADPAERQPTYY